METPSRPGQEVVTDQQSPPKQNLAIAIAAGAVAAVIGGIAWAVLTVTTEFQIGYMAVAIGFLVGFAVRLGDGFDKIFAYVGAILALFGCLLGNALSMIGFYAKAE